MKGLNGFTAALDGAMADVAQRVQRSLVVVQDGRRGVGSGIIWQRDGLILTNNHVVMRGRARVTLADGREFDAHILAQDPEIDLAMLQIERLDLPAAMIADSHDLRVGQLVMAVGHPWGQRGVVTAGLISSLGSVKTRGQRGTVDVIRSDVSLAPGNSGGPLVNATGALVGINTMILGGDLSLAIPSHVASSFVSQVLAVNSLDRVKQKKSEYAA